MGTVAVSLTSGIDPGAIGYEVFSRSLRDTSMSGACFSRTLAAGTTAVIALSTLAARHALRPSDHHFVRTSGPQLLYSGTSCKLEHQRQESSSWDLVSSGPSLHVPA